MGTNPSLYDQGLNACDDRMKPHDLSWRRLTFVPAAAKNPPQHTPTAQPFQRREFQAATLIREFEPIWNGRNKRRVFEIACSQPHPFEGNIVYTRWKEASPPAQVVTGSSTFRSRKGVFEYEAPDDQSVAWHVNFADPGLFTAYSTGLFAQDEIQVSEHPILASLREAFVAEGTPPRTADADGRPTPVTISGVQRRCVVNTAPSAKSPRGLYGNEFQLAREEQIIAATKPLSPPTISNILAMAAPAHGRGAYTTEQIALVLNTAYTGFAAARCESVHLGSPTHRVVVHTGFWGCGVFGGNRSLMTILQCLAADLAGVHLEFWAFDTEGSRTVDEAKMTYARLVGSGRSVPEVLTLIEEMRFQWG